MRDYITIIGGGLAGSEAAYQIAKKGIKVKLYEMKPDRFSPAHSNKNLILHCLNTHFPFEHFHRLGFGVCRRNNYKVGVL